ncbi:MAG: hypothetical protein LUE27_03385 [Clostridia bacterium]|nr:hypothetical protein [Clostridia bacterium]
MDLIVIIVIVVIVFVLILSSYSKGKHVPKDVKPKDKPADEDHRYIEVRATEDQLKELEEDFKKQGWEFESRELKPNTKMFSSDVWILSFHRMPPPPAEPAEPAPQSITEDPFGMQPVIPEQAADADAYGLVPLTQVPAEAPFTEHPLDEDPFGIDPAVAEEDPFGDELTPVPPADDPLSQNPAEEQTELPAEGQPERPAEKQTEGQPEDPPVEEDGNEAPKDEG